MMIRVVIWANGDELGGIVRERKRLSIEGISARIRPVS
jgi:hypothetical protein